MALRNLLVRVGADLSGLQKGMKQAQTQINNFGNNINKSMKLAGAALAAVGTALTAGAIVGTKDAIKFEALMGTLGETLGANIKDFEKWQTTVGAALGFSKLQSAELANTLSLNFKQIATSQKDLMDKTTKMMETAALISNKRGMAMTEVSDRIRSAMNQEADGADELGVNVRVSAIEQSKAYKEMANGTPWADLNTNMQKAILYHHVLQSVSANLGDTLQNNTQMKMSAFTASLGDVRLALGQAFLPILNVTLPLLTAFMRKVEVALQYVSAFSRALFGTAEFGAQQSKATQQQAVAIGGLGDATEKAGKQAKKAGKDAKRGVAGFDQINQLADPSSADSGAGADSGGSGGGMSVSDQMSGEPDQGGIFDKISKKAKEFAKKFKKWMAPLGKAWDSLKESMSDLWNSPAIKKFRKWMASGWGAGFEGVVLIIAGALEILAGGIDIVNGLLNGDWKKAWNGVEKILGGFWDIITGTIGPLFPGLTKKMKDFGDNFSKKWESIKNINFAELALKMVKVFTDIKTNAEKKFKEIKDTISTKFTEAKTAAVKIAGDLWTGVKNKFIDSYTWFKTNVTDKITSAFANVKEAVKSKAGEIWSGVKGKFTSPYEWFRDNVVKKFIEAFHNWKGNVANKAGEVWTSVKGKFSGAYEWFRDHVVKKPMEAFNNWRDSIANAAGNVWGAIKGKFTDVYGWFKRNVADKISSALWTISSGVSDGFKGVVTSVINKGISLINSLITKLNGAIQYIDRHLLPGDAIPNIPQIPALAKGGITNGPTLALIGDNPGGKEVVSPLDKLQGMIGTAVMSAMQFNNSSGNSGGGDIILNIDGRQFARIVKPHLDKETKRVGSNVKLNPI